MKVSTFALCSRLWGLWLRNQEWPGPGGFGQALACGLLQVQDLWETSQCRVHQQVSVVGGASPRRPCPVIQVEQRRLVLVWVLTSPVAGCRARAKTCTGPIAVLFLPSSPAEVAIFSSDLWLEARAASSDFTKHPCLCFRMLPPALCWTFLALDALWST